MQLYEKEVVIPAVDKNTNLLSYFSDQIKKNLKSDETVVRFVITESSSSKYHCELGVLQYQNDNEQRINSEIFDFKKLKNKSSKGFNAVVIIPTGIGAEIGGHAGDANRVIRLLAAACDLLITHPNAVNAADINEMPNNSLYVEGSTLSRFLMGQVGLQEVASNRVLVAVDDLRKDELRPENKIFTEAAINSASSAIVTLGLECSRILLMEETISMKTAFSNSGRAVGQIEKLDYLISIIDEFKEDCDAIALSTVVDVEDDLFDAYYQYGTIVNPWGGVEAMLTHAISLLFDLPAAHSPMLDSIERLNADLGIVDPRIAPEAVSITALHSVLKGMHKSPRIIPFSDQEIFPGALNAADISCLVTPDGCIGLPHLAAIEQGIPIIAVRDGQQTMKNNLQEFPFKRLYFADNYLEAAGMLLAMREGIYINSLDKQKIDANKLIAEVTERGESYVNRSGKSQ